MLCNGLVPSLNCRLLFCGLIVCYLTLQYYERKIFENMVAAILYAHLSFRYLCDKSPRIIWVNYNMLISYAKHRDIHAGLFRWKIMKELYQSIMQKKDIKHVIAWSQWAEGTRFGVVI